MELYERIDLVAKRLAGSQAKLAELLGLRQKQLNGYLKLVSQRNLWEHLPKILELFPKVSRNWLFFGEGEPFYDSNSPEDPTSHILPPSVAREIAPTPLIGFAACGVDGWYGTMHIPVPVEPPVWHDSMIAVMASGESMLPAGISHGHICYCDTTKLPAKGEAVFVELVDGSGAIKLFMGRTERAGKDYISLQGWLDKKDENTPQKPYTLDVLESRVRHIAPVMYVRRRL